MEAPTKLTSSFAKDGDHRPPAINGVRIRRTSIHDLGEASYRILKPIPVEIKTVEVGDVEASFREANIAMSGADTDDALQALVADILDTFDVLISEHNLGPDAAEQRRLLRTYIAKT